MTILIPLSLVIIAAVVAVAAVIFIIVYLTELYGNYKRRKHK